MLGTVLLAPSRCLRGQFCLSLAVACRHWHRAIGSSPERHRLSRRHPRFYSLKYGQLGLFGGLLREIRVGQRFSFSRPFPPRPSLSFTNGLRY